MQNSISDNGCSTSVTLNTNTTENWYFAIYNTGSDILKENGFFGNTKASISLIQQTL